MNLCSRNSKPIFLVAMALAFLFSGCVHRSSKGGSKARPNGPSHLVTVRPDNIVRIYSKTMLEALQSARPKKGVPGIRVKTMGSDGHHYTLVLDPTQATYSLSLPEVREEARKAGKQAAPIFASWKDLPHRNRTFLPAVALALKAKQFDDGLVAAVEMASEKGLGSLPAKPGLLADMLQAFQKGHAREAAAIVAAALRAGGGHPKVSGDLEKNIAAVLGRRSLVQKTPIGVYTWSQELAHIYLRDKVLQMTLTNGSKDAMAAAKALLPKPGLADGYQRYLRLAERLTNRLQFADLRKAVAALKQGNKPVFRGKIALFPPSRSPETDLALALFGNKHIPDDFRLSDEIIKRIRAGTLKLEPKPDSGWYLWQLHALEAIIQVEKLPEGSKLSLDVRYRKELEGLFKALYGLTRETHIKQLYTPMAGARAPMPETKVKLSVPMLLDTEPLVTFYERRAASYRFVRQVLEETFGKEALKKLHRWTASGPINMDLDEELALMESLFLGAAQRARRQLGMNPETTESAQEAKLVAWRKQLASDPDLGQDIRMMVPVFIDRERGKVRAWALLGMASRDLIVSYSKNPKVTTILDEQGKPMPLEKFDLSFQGAEYDLPYLVSAEVWTSKVMDRPTFRRLCDKYRTFKDIVAHIH